MPFSRRHISKPRKNTLVLVGTVLKKPEFLSQIGDAQNLSAERKRLYVCWPASLLTDYA